MQRAAGQHPTAPGHAASLIAAAQEPIAAATKQQTGNEHLDGKLKIIGIVSLFQSSYVCLYQPAGPWRVFKDGKTDAKLISHSTLYKSSIVESGVSNRL